MKVWIVFTEREWDWQTHKEIDSVHATKASAEDCSGTLRNSLVEEHEVYGSTRDAATKHCTCKQHRTDGRQATEPDCPIHFDANVESA
jgi:hypothetical protein